MRYLIWVYITHGYNRSSLILAVGPRGVRRVVVVGPSIRRRVAENNEKASEFFQSVEKLMESSREKTDGLFSCLDGV